MRIKIQLAGFFRLLRGKGLTGQLIRNGISGITIKVASMLLGLAVVVILARTLGPESYGMYTFIFALISILTIPAQFGLPRLVVRETAKSQVNKQWELVRGVWMWSSLLIAVLSILLVSLALTILWFNPERFTKIQISIFQWGLVLVPLVALANMRSSALIGLRHIVLGSLPENIIRPGLFVLFLLLLFWLDGKSITAASAMKLHVLAAGVSFFVGTLFLYYSRPLALRSCTVTVYEARAWFSSVIPLALTGGFQVINQYTDIIMLGIFETSAKVGIYRVAVQISLLVVFGLQVVNLVSSPYFSRFYTQNDPQRLQRLVAISGQVVFLLALLIGFVLAVWGQFLIGILFGEEYSAAYVPLLILVVGQIINASFGPVGILLNMTGHERDAALGVAVAAAMNILLNLILIPLFGMKGAAIATALSLVIWNILLWKAVRREIGIESFVFSNFKNHLLTLKSRNKIRDH